MTAHRRLLCRIALAAALLGVVLASACFAAEYGDVTMQRKPSANTDDVPVAIFPHWIHRMQYKCAACHDELFRMKAGSSVFTMDEMQEGKFCSACHDGKAAFESNFDTCTRCHRK